MTSIRFLFIFVLIYFYLSEINAGYDGRTCITPNGEKTVCRKIQHCPAFHGNSVLQEFLAESTCGYEATQYQKEVKLDKVVCCGSVGFYQDIKGNRIKRRQQSLLPDREICGQSETSDRIVGGKATSLGEFPWMALLSYVGRYGPVDGFYCGGSLINDRYVLTAAHCVTGEILQHVGNVYQVRLGEFDINEKEDCLFNEGCSDPPVDILVEEVIPHERYDDSRRDRLHDIALIRLKFPIQNFTDFISPICLPTQGETVSKNDIVFAAGWGRTGEDEEGSNIKLKVPLTIPDQNQCFSLYQRGGHVELSDSQVCAGGNAGKDTCGGDSGGPLMKLIPRSSLWYIEGITSFGPSQCGTGKAPGIYTKVAKYLDWIQEKIRP